MPCGDASAISASVVHPPAHFSLLFSCATGTSIDIRFSTGPHVLESVATAVFTEEPFLAVHRKCRHFPLIACTLVHFDPTNLFTATMLRRENPPRSRRPPPLHTLHARRPLPQHRRHNRGSDSTESVNELRIRRIFANCKATSDSAPETGRVREGARGTVCAMRQRE